MPPQVPSPPGDEDDDFILVHHSDVQPSDKAEQVYAQLMKIVREQHEVRLRGDRDGGQSCPRRTRPVLFFARDRGHFENAEEAVAASPTRLRSVPAEM